MPKDRIYKLKFLLEQYIFYKDNRTMYTKKERKQIRKALKAELELVKN